MKLLSVVALAGLVSALTNFTVPALEFLEAVAAHNELAYAPAVHELFVEDNAPEDVLAELDIAPTLKEAIQQDWDNHVHVPALEAMQASYNELIATLEWNDDSFGNPIDPTNWVWYNGRVHSFDDLYAIKSDAHLEPVEPLDRVIGDEGPVMIFYGDYKTEEFEQWMNVLWHNADGGKHRFVWRYIVA